MIRSVPAYDFIIHTFSVEWDHMIRSVHIQCRSCDSLGMMVVRAMALFSMASTWWTYSGRVWEMKLSHLGPGGSWPLNSNASWPPPWKKEPLRIVTLYIPATLSISHSLSLSLSLSLPPPPPDTSIESYSKHSVSAIFFTYSTHS